MKKIISLFYLLSTLLSCDPAAVLEASLINETDQNLTVVFLAKDTYENLTLTLSAHSTALFQDGIDLGNTYLEPNLTGYYCVQIRDASEMVLKAYLPEDGGKNIFDAASWNSQETARRNYIYEFVITNQDLQ